MTECPPQQLLPEAEHFKNKGNSAFAGRDFQQAVAHYTRAIDLSPQATYFSNRSAAYFQLKEYEKAHLDAAKAAELDPNFVKAYYRNGLALAGMGKYFDAIEAINKVAELNHSVGNEMEQIRTLYFDHYFTPKLKSTALQVKWVDESRGRGVFAARDITEGDIVMERIDSCSYCLKAILRPDNLTNLYKKFHSKVYPNPKAAEWHYCPHCKDDPICGEKYCSQACLQTAWTSYHKLMCGGNKTPSLVNSNPLMEIYSRCRAEGKTNPLLIARMMAIIATNVVDKGMTLDYAMEDFKLFQSIAETPPQCFLELEVVSALKQLVGSSGAVSVFTIELYRFLYGVITRNASSLLPVSDWHKYIDGLPEKEQHEIVDMLDAKLTIGNYMQSTFMLDLCIEGTGLFPIANSLNHSCEPNTTLACASNSNHLLMGGSRITIIALRGLKRGEELLISYIDEDAKLTERKSRLKEFYGFDCECVKCRTEKV